MARRRVAYDDAFLGTNNVTYRWQRFRSPSPMLGPLRGREERFRLSDRKPEGDESRPREAYLAASYYLDRSDPDIPILRRRDGSFVAAFSASGVTREGILEAAREDFLTGGLLRRAYDGEEGAADER
jgi:hypothetical protein